MNYISTSWDEIKPNVIRNYFQKAVFDVWNDLEEADSSPLEDEGFQILQNFPDYAMVNDDLVTSCSLTLDEMIADAIAVVNVKEEDSKQEKENEQMKDNELTPTPTVTAGFQHLSELRKVLASLKHTDEMLTYANKIDNFPSAIHI